MRQQALRMILSDKVAHDRLVVVEAWATINSAKTKKLGTALASLPSKQKKTLIVTTPKDSVVIRSARNLPKVTSIGVGSLNVLDLLAHEYVVVPKDLISIIEKRYR
ncbi:MAG: 50S ribosomal protein L4 [Candidatus Komeilibacteria bacterium RIFCSPLOWO2_01_FULL_53_11]|uniref:Large ribosomal subunit protein uL4 n=1 Tax=Candidatus Komeilibacteria bacterium RIFCSPLOWO2_01_FULL_53_11 TaxID=1798552 RepID=A0A1G2BUF2_9BACT|nr:MAG: 50S ribosomal protein L4 [Candidatus Komeilibacteria bacterium RIFCSPLOWO2_01_FULL_53_11]